MISNATPISRFVIPCDSPLHLGQVALKRLLQGLSLGGPYDSWLDAMLTQLGWILAPTKYRLC